jgi:hypothetical protein
MLGRIKPLMPDPAPTIADAARPIVRSSRKCRVLAALLVWYIRYVENPAPSAAPMAA